MTNIYINLNILHLFQKNKNVEINTSDTICIIRNVSKINV